MATVHLTEIVQKAKRELHLCERCAQARGVTIHGTAPVGKPAEKESFAVKDLFGGFEEEVEAASCPDCGVGLEEFRRSGRLGCARDYDHFRAELLPLLERIHGARQHTGRVPHGVEQRLARSERLDRYRRELEAAVAREAYEEAARLRDAILALEGSA
ncbi:MAG: UvrB/UvrC motif-containing protein [Planctomycetota bacterium]